MPKNKVMKTWRILQKRTVETKVEDVEQLQNLFCRQLSITKELCSGDVLICATDSDTARSFELFMLEYAPRIIPEETDLYVS
jgi:hypothetical protein